MCNKAICDISHKRGPLDKALVKWSSRTLCPSLSAYALFFREVKRLTARKAVFVNARPTEFSITIISNDCLELFERGSLGLLLPGYGNQLLAEELGILEGGIAADPACRGHAVNSVTEQRDVLALPGCNGSGDAQRSRDDRAWLGQAHQVSQRGMPVVDHVLSHLEQLASR